MFTIPFFMAPLEHARRASRRTRSPGYPWGEDFRYREVMRTPGNARGLAMAVGITGGLAGVRARDHEARRAARADSRSARRSPARARRSRSATHGHWKVRCRRARRPALVYIAADDHGDPGYGSTAKMLGESALCLALDPLTLAGWRAHAVGAMGATLLAERPAHAPGLTFAT